MEFVKVNPTPCESCGEPTFSNDTGLCRVCDEDFFINAQKTRGLPRVGRVARLDDLKDDLFYAHGRCRGCKGIGSLVRYFPEGGYKTEPCPGCDGGWLSSSKRVQPTDEIFYSAGTGDPTHPRERYTRKVCSQRPIGESSLVFRLSNGLKTSPDIAAGIIKTCVLNGVIQEFHKKEAP